MLDALAEQLKSGIALDDSHYRLLAVSPGPESSFEFDLNRLGRRASAVAHARYEQLGIGDAEAPVLAEPDAEQEAAGFVGWCVPVVFRRVRLGHLWVVDHRLPRARLAVASDVAEQIGAILYRRTLSIQADSGLLRLLLSPGPHDDGVAETLALRSHPRDTRVAVVVARFAHPGKPGDGALNDLETAVQRASEQAPYDSTVGGVILGAGVLITTLSHPDDLGPAKELARQLHGIVSRLAPDEECLVAVGAARELDQAGRSWTEARRALRIAKAIPEIGPVIAWDDLGIFKAVASLTSAEIEESVIDARVRRLLADDTLAQTTQVFLHLAGNVREVASALFLHRTTLYQRLDRIRQLYDLDLRHSGEDRLVAHLGLKLVRLTRDDMQSLDPLTPPRSAL